MAKEEATFEVEGVVVDVLKGLKFLVDISNENMKHTVTCTLSGKLKMNNIRILRGDKVDVEVSIIDPSVGRIVWRYK